MFGEDPTSSSRPQNLTAEDATFTTENDQMSLSILVHSIDRSESYKNIQFTLYMDIKE